MSEVSAGQTLRDGRYVLVRRLGEGTQAVTWEGVDKKEGCAVAIKRFDVRGAKAWKDVELAEREARVLAKLAHPLLPKYVEHFEADGALYLVMELINGKSLSVLRKQGPMDPHEVIQLLSDGADVLEYLHGRAPSVIHRDIKPGNVIRRPDGRYCVVDFGAVRERLRAEGGSTVVGTFGYMAPEQFQGRAMPVTDVYALGATALALLTGEEPENLPHKGLAIDVRAALAGSTSRSAELVQALEQMLAPNPDERVVNVKGLVANLKRKDSDWRDGNSRPSPSTKTVAAKPLEVELKEVGRIVERQFADLGQELRGKFGRQIDRERDRAARKQRRKDEKEERRQQKRAAEPNQAHSGGWQSVPWPIRLFLMFGLIAGQIAVTLALRVAIPTLFGLLSIVFGAGLRRAGEAVSLAGREANRAMREAHHGMWQRSLPRKTDSDELDAKVRVAEIERDRMRVDDETRQRAIDHAEEQQEQARKLRNRR